MEFCFVSLLFVVGVAFYISSCGKLVSVTIEEEKSSIRDHDPHTPHAQHQWLHRLSHPNSNYTAYLSQSYAIIWHNTPQSANSEHPLFNRFTPSHSFTSVFHLLVFLFILCLVSWIRHVTAISIAHPLPLSAKYGSFDLDRNQNSSPAETYQNANDDR